MITEFKTIKNLAVFKDFDWDLSMRDKGNNVVSFTPINIIYGRNYSGKTTLSRVVRALETGIISDKYENPQFRVFFGDGTESNESNLNNHRKKIRVFNRDFIRDNLKFITNPDDSIVPFAILGGNATLENEIQKLKSQLGTNEANNESGYYLELKNALEISNTSQKNYNAAKNNLESQLSRKATDRNIGIKYKPEIYGDQNYTKPKLETDIGETLKPEYEPISDEKKKELLKLLEERIKPDIKILQPLTLSFKTLSDQTNELITKKVGNSDKIEQLVKNAVLNKWVKEGKALHKDKLTECAFCGSAIGEERWAEIDKHFDEESEKLEKDITNLIANIDTEIQTASTYLNVNKDLFYSSFHPKIDRIIKLYNYCASLYIANLKALRTNLEQRKDDLINPQVFTEQSDYSKRLMWVISTFETARKEANNYSNSLGQEQNNAKHNLRLREVHDFVQTIQFRQESETLGRLYITSIAATKHQQTIAEKIGNHINLIKEKERLMNDEEKGAIKVNEYLNNFFGHEFLTLQAIANSEQGSEQKHIKFEIIRNGKKAHHLSEGECSLIAFCYFMAKLDDIETSGTKPIIWIDDPISSLDNNHIFFVYSLINSELVAKQGFEQLFVSTHNLDFLKYLKRLPAIKNQCSYFIINRENDSSAFKPMPRYLKDYVTEFNFLFHQLYSCANADSNDENSHSLFYNFGNNTRKFLEAYLYYKYPNADTTDVTKLSRFFGNDNQASAMADRVDNEFSHLEGLFERSMTPVDIPEMKKTASYILRRIEQKDSDQYEAFLKSIGIEPKAAVMP